MPYGENLYEEENKKKWKREKENWTVEKNERKGEGLKNGRKERNRTMSF